MGVRNGTYVEIFKFGTLYNFLNKNKLSEKDYINYITNIFKELREIKNIDFYIGKIYDPLANFRDTLYVYYKPRKNKLFKIIKVIENYDRN